jgi:hypothetical protein
MKLIFEVGVIRQKTDQNRQPKKEWLLKVQFKDADGMPSTANLVTSQEGITPGKYSADFRAEVGVIKLTGQAYQRLIVSNLEKLK